MLQPCKEKPSSISMTFEFFRFELNSNLSNESKGKLDGIRGENSGLVSTYQGILGNLISKVLNNFQKFSFSGVWAILGNLKSKVLNNFSGLGVYSWLSKGGYW